jgi:thioredoxin-dependent peroxiredoxin
LRDDYERFTGLGAEVIAISAEGAGAAEAYLKSHPLPYPVAIDADHETFDAYDVTSRMMSLGQRPGLFVVDGDGIIRYDSIGTQQWQIPPNDEVLSALGSLHAS